MATYRFCRPLTETELAAVIDEAGARGVLAALQALWDLILEDAEGISWAQAVASGRVFDPGDYAIPRAQAGEIQRAMRRHGAALSRRPDVGMVWLDRGPALYDAAIPAQIERHEDGGATSSRSSGTHEEPGEWGVLGD